MTNTNSYLHRQVLVRKHSQHVAVLDADGADAEGLDIAAYVLLQGLHEGDGPHSVSRAEIVGEGALHQLLVQ